MRGKTMDLMERLRKLVVEARRERARRGGRGVTLVEIMVVLAIVGLIAGGVAFVAIPQLNKAKKDTAKNDALRIRQVAMQWKSDHSDECPDVPRLKTDALIDKASGGLDPWKHPYKIECDGEDVTVTSLGPDGKEGTDDIIVPTPDNTGKS